MTKNRIFISYSSEDRVLVEKLSIFLRSVFEDLGKPGSGADIELFEDQSIRTGTDFHAEILAQLRSANLVILLISPHYFRSAYAQFEAAVARSNDLNIFPARVGPIENSDLPPTLKQLSAVHVQGAGFTGRLTGEVERSCAPYKGRKDSTTPAREFEEWVKSWKYGYYPPFRLVNTKSITPDYLRRLAQSIETRSHVAVKKLHEASPPSDALTEPDYVRKLVGGVRSLREGERWLAICGSKNWDQPVYNYMNECVRVAWRDQVVVHRLYLEPNGGKGDDGHGFCPEEWGVIATHRFFAEQIPSFHVDVLVGSEAGEFVERHGLPEGFGLVVHDRPHHSSDVIIHYDSVPTGTNEDRRRGWSFDDNAIADSQKHVFDELLWKAQASSNRKRVDDAQEAARLDGRIRLHDLLLTELPWPRSGPPVIEYPKAKGT